MNLQIPEGAFSGNLWKCTDVPTYYLPAKNFLENGVFGFGTQPDYSRPMGYQFFLMILIKLLNNNWHYATYIIQSALFALIYPLLTSIIELVETKPKSRHIQLTFWVSLLSGIYFTRSIYIGPDVMLVFLLIEGVYFTIRTIKEQKWRYGIFAFFFIAFAAEVRPTLILYPVINLVIVYWLGMKFGQLKTRFTKIFLVTSTIVFLAVTNIPSLRNYSNYGIFKPTIILSANYYDYLSKKILLKENHSDYFYKTKVEIETNRDIKQQIMLKKEKAFEIISKYPLTTLKVIFIDNLKSVMIDNHLVNFTANFYGFNWKSHKNPNGCYTVKESRLVYWIYLLFTVFTLTIYIFFVISFYQLFTEKKYVFCALVILIIIIFLAPSIIIGDGGDRFRLPFEWVIVLVACRADLSTIKKWKLSHS
jgi:hypothetical protein